eukprot:GFUD01132440.1.p1 GENE.GFUD01132440.1~~GFUD01132440.1.p1  ORF type:complete len:529 (-),score=119.34 GFUD01132440.1:262-1848(-)
MLCLTHQLPKPRSGPGYSRSMGNRPTDTVIIMGMKAMMEGAATHTMVWTSLAVPPPSPGPGCTAISTRRKKTSCLSIWALLCQTERQSFLFLPGKLSPVIACSQTSRILVRQNQEDWGNCDHFMFSQFNSIVSSNHHRSLTSPAIVSTDILTYEVWRQSKNAREIISRNFAINIDELFTLLFTNSKFFYDFQAERKTFDIVQCPWQHSDKSEDKFREVSYTLNLNHSIGPKTSRATEVQTMRSNSVPGHIYNVDVETTNADIPYADSFYVSTHYCVVKASDNESLLTVLCDIKYKKTPWGLVKSFIEKNCWAGIEEHYAALAAGLDREIENRIDLENGKEVGIKKKTRRQRNQRRASASGESVGVNVPVGISQLTQGNSQPLGAQPGKKPSLKHDQTLFLVLLSMLGFLCLLNLFLIYKIWGLEAKISMRSDNLSSFQVFEQQPPSTSSDWLDILHKQEILHNQDLAGWRAAVEAASRLLQQTENSMLRLTQGFNRESNRRLLKHLLKLEEDTYGKAMFKDEMVEQEL